VPKVSVDSKKPIESNPSRILDEIVGLVQRYYLYNNAETVGATPESKRSLHAISQFILHFNTVQDTG